jgi:PIN domain nuclease of toxin-antitoxin system
MTGGLLLDSHLVFWWLYAPEQLPPRVRERVDGATGAVLVSDVTVWEFVVKRAAGKLRLDMGRFLEQLDADGFTRLPIDRTHLLAADQLPLDDSHRDPFDRLLVAQATVAGIPLLTADRALAYYGARMELV